MNPLLRLMDANANRAREGLRVMEDISRFVLDDGALSAALKVIRHDLRAALQEVPGIDSALLLAARDTEGDVGTRVSTPAEVLREGLRDIALAASGRVCEALRCIEEASKAVGSDGHAFEAIRYRMYTLEQRLGLALASGNCPQWRLCVLITESLCRRPWQQVAEAAISGGADCLQLREKSLDSRSMLDRARTLVRIATSGRAAAAVIVNDRLDVALAAGAGGVHLGQDDLPASEARRIVGDRLWIGVSTANIDQARGAARAGADYCGVGPMFPTTTKHKPVLSGPGYLREYLADPISSRLPHLAISGVTPENVAELAGVGARGVAVSAAVCGADDPEVVCRAIVRAMDLGVLGSGTQARGTASLRS